MNFKERKLIESKLERAGKLKLIGGASRISAHRRGPLEASGRLWLISDLNHARLVSPRPQPPVARPPKARSFAPTKYLNLICLLPGARAAHEITGAPSSSPPPPPPLPYRPISRRGLISRLFVRVPAARPHRSNSTNFSRLLIRASVGPPHGFSARTRPKQIAPAVDDHFVSLVPISSPLL